MEQCVINIHCTRYTHSVNASCSYKIQEDIICIHMNNLLEDVALPLQKSECNLHTYSSSFACKSTQTSVCIQDNLILAQMYTYSCLQTVCKQISNCELPHFEWILLSFHFIANAHDLLLLPLYIHS